MKRRVYVSSYWWRKRIRESWESSRERAGFPCRIGALIIILSLSLSFSLSFHTLLSTLLRHWLSLVSIPLSLTHNVRFFEHQYLYSWSCLSPSLARPCFGRTFQKENKRPLSARQSQDSTLELGDIHVGHMCWEEEELEDAIRDVREDVLCRPRNFVIAIRGSTWRCSKRRRNSSCQQDQAKYSIQ